MQIIRPEGTRSACPRCGLFHDPKDHGDHRHDFSIQTIRTCNALVRLGSPCACGEPAPHLRFSLGQQFAPIDTILRAVGHG